MASSTSRALTPVVGSPIPQNPSHAPSPATFQLPYLTPSPFPSISASSGDGLSSKVDVGPCSSLFLRSLVFILAFVSAIVLAAPSGDFVYLHHSEFRYNMIVGIIAAIYSALQLFKGIWRIAFKGFFITDKVSESMTFVLDQVMTYLLLSSSTVSLLETERIPKEASNSAGVASTCMSFAAFAVTAVLTHMSGYKLCKRIIW